MRVVLLSLVLLASLRGAISDEQLAGIFSPLKIDRAALSPNGERVAYALRGTDAVSVLVAEVDHPEHATARALAALDTLASGYRHPAFAPALSEVRWLDWIDNRRVALSTNLTYLRMGGTSRGAIYAFDADGKNPRELFDARHDRGSIDVIGLSPVQPREILFAFADEHRAVDAYTGKSRSLTTDQLSILRQQTAADHAATSERRKALRETLRQLLPTHEIDLLSDRCDTNRVLALAQSPADPGGFLVYEPATRRLWDFLRRSNAAQRALHTERFSLPGPDGTTVSGLLIYPVDPRLHRVPLVVWLSDLPGRAADRRYRPEVQALAEFGFGLVLFDEPKPSVGPGQIPQQAAFFTRAVEQLAAHFPVSRKSVALAGKAAGARRAFEIAVHAPRQFRCIVALLPSPDSFDRRAKSWRFSFVQDLPATSEPIVAATLACSWPGPPRKVSNSEAAPRGVAPSLPPPYGPHDATRAAIAALSRNGVDARLRVESDDFRAGQPAALATTFRTIESFLNEQLYRYSAQLGEIEVLGTDVPLPQR